MMRGIIVIEGSDATGKTTLARALHKKFGGRYLHLGVHKDVWKRHLMAIKLAARWADAGELVVIDRLWLSEEVYGQVFRGGPSYDTRPMDNLLKFHGALNVLCVRADQWRHLRDFEELKIVRREKFEDISRVVRLYADLARGDLTKQGDTPLDDLIRYGDFTQRPDVMLYDMDRLSADQAAGLAGARLRGLQRSIKDINL